MHKKKVFLTALILAAVFMTNTLFGEEKWFALQEQDNEDIRDYNAITFVSSREGWVVGGFSIRNGKSGIYWSFEERW